jgi:2-polyprenyl-3-methyl-5-hydroxy-6-metoxy-1,4-benzoquinol methylase
MPFQSDRYLYKATDPYSSHAQILGWVEGERPVDVLEVGTATGYLSFEMAKRGCTVTGIEKDPEMAKAARGFCSQMLTGDVETMNLQVLGRYDAIICADVLEHLCDPRRTLQQLRSLLKPDGRMLISLPNVAHIWVRINLLLGRFDYEKSGILDETHLHFFTLKSAKNFIASCGLEITDVATTPAPLPSIFPTTGEGRLLHLLHIFNWRLARLAKTLFGYQFIFTCRAKE